MIDWHSPELDIIDATTRDLQLCSQHRFGQQTNLRDQEQDVGLPQQHTSCTTTQEGHSQGHNFCLVPQSAASNASLSQQEVWSAPITSDVQRVVQATDDVPFAMPPHLYQQDTFGASRATYAAALTSSTGPSPATGSRRGAIAAPHLGNGKLKLVRRATGSLQAHLAPGGSTTYKRARCDVTSAPAQPASLEPIVDSQLAANPNFNLSNSNSAGTIEDWNTARRLPGDRSTTPPSLKLDTQLLQLPTTPSQASSAVSSPASASSARSARRSPIEMRSSPASFRCEHEDAGLASIPCKICDTMSAIIRSTATDLTFALSATKTSYTRKTSVDMPRYTTRILVCGTTARICSAKCISRDSIERTTWRGISGVSMLARTRSCSRPAALRRRHSRETSTEEGVNHAKRAPNVLPTSGMV